MLHLSADDLSGALADVQPLDVLGDEVAVRTADHLGARLSPWPPSLAGGPEQELVLLEDNGSGATCVLPAAALRGCRAAVLTMVAAQELLAQGDAHAAIIGCGAATDLQLATIARHLPSIRQIVVCPAGGAHACPIEQRALDEIDLADVRLVVTDDGATVAAATAAADLVVLACSAATWPAGVTPRTGAVVVNAGNQDLPDKVIDGVDRLLVDDRRLVAETNIRFARRGVDADLSEVLAGHESGRTSAEQIVLVELLSADLLDAALAKLLHRAAVERGLGSQLLD
jgi:ornithine cyclodeaminase/alanine dehydrogenase-like protein (mu-crystallin family)